MLTYPLPIATLYNFVNHISKVSEPDGSIKSEMESFQGWDSRSSPQRSILECRSVRKHLSGRVLVSPQSAAARWRCSAFPAALGSHLGPGGLARVERASPVRTHNPAAHGARGASGCVSLSVVLSFVSDIWDIRTGL